MPRKAAKKPKPRSRGQIKPRGENRWLISVFLGRGPDGRRKYSAKTIDGTYRKAEQQLTKMLREIDTGAFVEPAKQTLREFVTGYRTADEDRAAKNAPPRGWLATTVKPRVAARTVEDYRTRLERDVLPTIGGLKLDRITGQEIQALYAGLQEQGRAPRTIAYTHAVLKMALRQAVAWGLLAKNPADLVSPPRGTRTEMEVLTPEQVKLFLVVAAEHRPQYHALFAVLLLGGLRPGEALALTWSDIDGASLRVQRALVKVAGDQYEVSEPKTERSRRTVILPSAAQDALAVHRVRQARHMLAAGRKYARNGIVFANSLGKHMDISRVRRAWKFVLKKAKLPERRLYDARHSHATMLLAGGENVKVVSERLGHASVVMTLDTYSHVLPTMQQAAADRLDAMLKAASA